jgi:intracellular sulfur oxidation DsrE/DsrF family protein
MKQSDSNSFPPRRSFLKKISGGAAALLLGTLASPFKLGAKTNNSEEKIPGSGTSDAETWFDKITGKHKMVFDITKHNGGMFLTFVYNFLESNNKTGTPDKELSAVVSLRHYGIVLAMNDSIWEKYAVAEHVELKDAETKEFAKRNVFWDPKLTDAFPKNKSIKHLQGRGVLFCVCDTAIDSFAEWMSEEMKLDKNEVKKDFYANILPEIQLVPSGLWALGRAQEHGCGYCAGQ